ncbi:MAG: SusC/RagA family TonB-linked outer membrane protein, partial [Balneolales bacterium]
MDINMLYALHRRMLQVASMMMVFLCLVFSGPVSGQNNSDQEVYNNPEALQYATTEDRANGLLHFAPSEVNEKNRFSLNKTISVDLEDVRLEAALQHIADQGGLRLSYSKDVTKREMWDQRVSLQMKDDVTVLGALHAALDNTNLGLKISHHGVLIVHNDEQLEEPLVSRDLEELIVQEQVRGTVTDAGTGETLPGVNVVLEGTSTGTTTDLNGEYNLEVADSDAVLVFSYVGYATQEIIVGDQDALDVSMEADFASMDEMVVVGYGTVKKSDLTGSVQRMNSETFQSQNMTQLTDMLTGTIAGFNANQATSAAGGSSIEIRGPNSLTGGTEPLVVLDGVIYNGSLRDINPNDIETIDILKDASSAAVFGAKAASGVILVTTSRGERGAPTINLSTSVSGSEVGNKNIRPLTGEGYTEFRRDLLILENSSRPNYYYHNPAELSGEVSLEEWRGYSSNPEADNTREWLNRLLFTTPEIQNYMDGRSENWYDRVIQSGIRQNYDLSLSGGTEDVRYYWSLGYTDNEGIIAGDEFSATRSRLNIDADAADFLKIGLNSQFSVRDESAVTANLGGMLNSSPYGMAFDEEGNLNWFPNDQLQTSNPLVNYLYQDRDMKINSFFGSLYAEISLPFGINHRVSFQPRFETFREYDYWSPLTMAGGRDVSDGRAERTDFTRFEWMVDNLLKWDREFGGHRFDVTLLHSVENNRSWNSFMQNVTFSPSPALGYSGMQFGNNPLIETEDTKVTGDALMGRVNYTLLNKYLFTASVRRDGYSAFGQDKPRAIFPAAAFAWQISEERFFNVDWMNQLKLRLSWGINGNRDIGAYSALAQLDGNQYSDGSRVLAGVYNTSLANPCLAWVQTES